MPGTQMGCCGAGITQLSSTSGAFHRRAFRHKDIEMRNLENWTALWPYRPVVGIDRSGIQNACVAIQLITVLERSYVGSGGNGVSEEIWMRHDGWGGFIPG